MALQKQTISLPLFDGLDTKTDSKQAQIGSLKDLENTIFDTVKKLRKRNGYSLILTKQVNNTQITNAKSLAAFKKELCLLTDTDFYTYSKSLEKWVDKGNLNSAFPTSSPIIRNNYEQKNIDTLHQDGFNIFCYEDAQGVHLSIVDSESGSFIANNTVVSSIGIHPRLARIQNKIYVFYAVGTDIRYKTVNLIEPTNLSSETTLVSDLNATDKRYDAKGFSDAKIIIAYNATSQLSIIGLNPDDTTSSTINVAGEVASDAISIDSDSTSRVLVSWSDGSNVKMVILPLNLGALLLSATTIEAVANVSNVTVIEKTSEIYTALYEITGSIPKDSYIKINTVTLAGSVGTASEVIRSVGLASKSFLYNDKIYFTAVHDSTLQATYFVADEDGVIVSKISNNLAGGLLTENTLPKVEAISNDEFLIGSQIKGRLVTDEGTFNSLLGVNSTQIDFQITNPYQNDVLGENLHITGGVLKMYDGSKIVEHGFNIFPEDLTAGSTSTTGGSMVDGQYLYQAVYSWTDAYGQIHQSAPSSGLTVTLSGGTSTQKQTINVPTLRLTDKENVIIDLYRTEADGTIAYKVTSTSSPVFNDKTVDTIAIEDTLGDSSLISNEILYTVGGFLDNISAPASRLIESFNDRIFLAGLEDPNKVVFSKIRDEAEPVEFNDTLYKMVNDVGGDITALHVMDDKLIIFKQDALFYISGDGPNDLGEQDTYIEPERISSEVGCIDPRSVVLTPVGLMFKSRKGIYILTRALGLQYIGADVEDFNDLTVTSAIVVPSDNQVRFTTSDGECLVFNYFTQKWATFTNHRALDAITVDSDYYYLRPDGAVYKEADDKFTDHGSSINIALESNWISFGDVQGFQRVRKLFILGTYKSKHKLRVRIAYNFKEAFTEEVIIDTADFTDDTAYGEDSPYGDPSTKAYGGSGNVWQARVDLNIQKCQSLKFRIEEIQDDEIGEGLSIDNIYFEVGIKQGGFKIDESRKYGTNDA